jgi:hypothetical protein
VPSVAEKAATKGVPVAVEAAAKDDFATSLSALRSMPSQAGADLVAREREATAAGGATAPKATPWTSGGRAEDPAFSVWLEAPAEVVVGKPSLARVRVVAKEPYKCNDKYSAKFRWDAHDGLSVGSTKVSGMSVAGKNGTLALPFSAVGAGPVTLSGTLSFSVCTQENCRVEKRKLRLSTNAIPRG